MIEFELDYQLSREDDAPFDERRANLARLGTWYWQSYFWLLYHAEYAIHLSESYPSERIA